MDPSSMRMTHATEMKGTQKMGLKTWLTKATLNAAQFRSHTMVMSPALGQPSLVPRPIAHVMRVWCSEQHFFSHEVGAISDLRSPIRLQKT